MPRILARYACAVALAVPALSAQAEIVIGVDVSTTGPAAAIGIQTNNAIRLWPNTLGGEPARYVVLDDGTTAYREVVEHPGGVCILPFTGHSVILVRQLSDSRCVQGQTWGWDARGVWVDRGCRGEFRAW